MRNLNAEELFLRARNRGREMAAAYSTQRGAGWVGMRPGEWLSLNFGYCSIAGVIPKSGAFKPAEGSSLLWALSMGDPSLRLKTGSGRDDSKSEQSGIQMCVAEMISRTDTAPAQARGQAPTGFAFTVGSLACCQASIPPVTSMTCLKPARCSRLLAIMLRYPLLQ